MKRNNITRYSSKTAKTIAFILALTYSFSAFPKSIEIGVLSTSSQQRAVFVKHAKQLEAKHPSLDLSIKFLSDADFKQALGQWLSSGQGPEIFTWQGGHRLVEMVQADQVHDLSAFWSKHDLNSRFTAGAVEAVSFKGKPFAIPSSYYQWGFFYRKSLFNELGIDEPVNWRDFISVCEIMRARDIDPITIGARNKWPSAAWFDYLNLRINGLTFHQRLLQGKESFLSNEVRQVFVKWKELLDKECFTSRYNGWAWSEAMPFLYHKMAGMTLVGNFFASSLPKTLVDDFGFFPFPVIDPNIERFEEAPLDLFVVPKYTNIDKHLELVLVSLTEIGFLNELNEAASTISPASHGSNDAQDYFVQKGQRLLASAKGLSQFFDRDTPTSMAQTSTEIFTNFMDHRNIDKVTQELEAASQRYLKEK